jgi:hypothetical protein
MHYSQIHHTRYVAAPNHTVLAVEPQYQTLTNAKKAFQTVFGKNIFGGLKH